MKIDNGIKSEKEFVHFDAIYCNFDCIEFTMLKQKYQKDAEFKILPLPNYPSVSNMKIVYNDQTDKLDIQLI